MYKIAGMKNTLLIVILIIFCLTTNAQDSTIAVPEFGKIDIAELQMKDCSTFPGYAAVNLLKYKQVELYIYPNGTTEVVTFTRFRIKIFNKNGYKSANINIPFNGENTRVKNIQAATYNINASGQVETTPVNESDIFKTDISKNDNYKSVKFTFPNVKEGSVLEYQVIQKYKMEYFVPSWYFQDNIPNLLTVYKITRPPFSELKERIIAGLPVEQMHFMNYSKGFDQRRLNDEYVMRNVPAFAAEVFMSSPFDYKYRMDFLVDKTTSGLSFNIWYPANAWLLRSPYFGGVFEARIPGTKSFIDSVKHLNNTPDKIRCIYSFVKQKVKWVHVYYKYSRELDEVWKDGKGTSAEINLSILNLLRKCGVQCFPALYSTRQHGKVDYTFPDLSQFNTVNVVVVNGKKFNLLDGTNAYLSFDTPPFNVLNRTGMLIDPVNHTKINIDFDRKLMWDSTFVSAYITPNGTLKGEITKKYFDLARSREFQNEEEGEDDNSTPTTSVSDIKIDSSWKINLDDELLPLIKHSIFQYDLPATNNFYFLEPFLFSDLSKNPFVDSTRMTDIDFGSSMATNVQIKIALTKGIKLEEIPQNKEIYGLDSAIIFTCHNEIKKDTLIISNTLEIKRPIFYKKEYLPLKKVFENIYETVANQVLFRKIDQ